MTKRSSTGVIAMVLIIGLSFGLMTGRRPTVTIAQQMPTEMAQIEKAAHLIVYGKVMGAGVAAQTGRLVQAITASGAVAAVAAVQADGWFSFPALPPAAYQLRVVDEQGTPLALTEESDRLVRPIPGEQPYQLVIKATIPSPMPDVNPAIVPTAPALPVAASLVITATQSYPGQESGVTVPAQPDRVSQPVQPTGNARIRGRVTLLTTGAPAAFVPVLLRNPTVATAAPLAEAFTNDQGDYEFANVNAGSYKIAVPMLRFTQYTDYLPRYYNNQESFASADVVTVQDITLLTGINIALQRAPVVVGRVTTAGGGEPFAFAAVRVYTSTQATRALEQEVTDAHGYYTLTVLTTGNVYLQVPDVFKGNRPYLGEYHDNQRTLQSATPINLSANTTTTINFALDEGGKITGRVTAALTNQPLTGADMQIYAYAAPTADISVFGLLQGGETFFSFTSASSNVNGDYVLRGLRSGGYKVEFADSCQAGVTYETLFYNQQATLAQANVVNVTAPTAVNNINGALALRAGSVAPPTPTPIPPQFLKNNAYLPMVRR